MRERLFFLVSLPLAAGAAVCGAGSRVPHPVPDYALQASSVYRAEVALALFAAGYLILVCIRLAWHGKTFTRIGSTLEVPEISPMADGFAVFNAMLEQLTTTFARLNHTYEQRQRSHAVAQEDSSLG